MLQERKKNLIEYDFLRADSVKVYFVLQRTNEVDFYPVHLPDDVPVDFLEGNMDLLVTLPTQKSVRMSVERR